MDIMFLQDGWFEYDENAQREVTITEIEFKFDVLKWLSACMMISAVCMQRAKVINLSHKA